MKQTRVSLSSRARLSMRVHRVCPNCGDEDLRVYRTIERNEAVLFYCEKCDLQFEVPREPFDLLAEAALRLVKLTDGLSRRIVNQNRECRICHATEGHYPGCEYRVLVHSIERLVNL